MRFADAWRGLYQPAMQEVRSGEMPWTKLDDLHRDEPRPAHRDFGITGLTEAEIDHLNRAWHRLDPWPDAVPGLTRLKKRYILATLSNGNVALMVNMAKRAGLPWDAILGAEVGARLQAAARGLSLHRGLPRPPPRQCLMVAAHNGDLVAAARSGFRTAFVPRPTEHGAGQTRTSRAEHAFDVVATDFVDLAARLGC